MTFYSEEKLPSMGFRYIGKHVCLSDKAIVYNPGAISIGDYSRIDDFCILSAGEGGIQIGRNVHIACYCSLIGQGVIRVEDFCGLSARTTVFSSNDDYSGYAMTNPTIPDVFKNVQHGDILFKKHALIGAGSLILPNVTIGTGAVIGAMSLVKHDCEEFWVYAGTPAVKIKERSRKLLELEKQYLDSPGAKES
jgi:galactoside O-acetyltransferase